MREELADLARLRPGRIDLEAPLVELGLDSIAAITLRHRIAARLGVEVPADEVLMSETIWCPPPMSSTISLMTAPCLIETTVPRNWLRALMGMGLLSR